VEEIDPSLIDPETGGLLPEKYNYLKVENVFSGKIVGSERLFSIEVALLTKQSSILSDLFIAALAEIEAQVVAEITNVVLEVELGQLESVDGRAKLTSAIRDQVNKYLEEDLDMFPGITEVFIINYNVI
jgi:flagellar basal body-associated protein FliL